MNQILNLFDLFQLFWLYSSLMFQELNIYLLLNILGVAQHCICYVLLLVYSQASITREISKTVQILHDKFYQQFKMETEILTLKILIRNLDDRASKMYSIGTPLIGTVRQNFDIIF